MGAEEKFILRLFVDKKLTHVEPPKQTGFDPVPFFRLEQKLWISYTDYGPYIELDMEPHILVFLTDHRTLLGRIPVAAP